MVKTIFIQKVYFGNCSEINIWICNFDSEIKEKNLSYSVINNYCAFKFLEKESNVGIFLQSFNSDSNVIQV